MHHELKARCATSCFTKSKVAGSQLGKVRKLNGVRTFQTTIYFHRVYIYAWHMHCIFNASVTKVNCGC